MRRLLVSCAVLLFLGTASAGPDAEAWTARLEKDPLAASVRLSKLGGEALPVLRELMAHESAPVRRGAVLTAGRLGETAGPLTEALRAALSDPAPSVRAAAAWALGRVDTGRPAPGLFEALTDESEAVRLAAAAALEGYRTAAVRPLLDLLEGGDDRTRATVLRVLAGLGRFGLDASFHPVLGLLADEDEAPGVRAFAGMALCRMISGRWSVWNAAEGVPEWFLMHGPEEAVQFALHCAGTELFDVPALAAALDHESGNVRLEAVLRLADRLGAWEDAAAAPLARALEDPDLDVRRAAAMALSTEETGVALLIEALGSEDAEVRSLAARNLDISDRTRAPLLRALEDEDPRVRAAAADSLVHLPKPVAEETVRALLDRLRDPDPEVAREVAWSLYCCEDAVVVPRLVAILAEATDPELRRRCLRIFAQMDMGALGAREAILARLKDDDLLVRAEAANALGAVTGELALLVPVLVDAIEGADPAARIHICRRLRDTYWMRVDTWEGEGAPLARVMLRLYLEATGDLFLVVREAFFDRNFDEFPEADRVLEIEACLTSLREERKARVEAREGGLSGHRMPMASGTFSGGRLYPWAAARNLGRLEAKEPEALELLTWAAGGDDPILAAWAKEALEKIRGKK